MSLVSRMESILFVASKPLTEQQLAKALDVSVEKIIDTLETIKMKFNHQESGIHLLVTDSTVQFASNANHSDDVSKFVKNEISGELTKAQLETLTVIAYRSPVTKPEIEQIRGVNCTIIIRNLLMRDLIIEDDDITKIFPVYSLSTNALAHLGIQSTEELPEYETLSVHDHIEQSLAN